MNAKKAWLFFVIAAVVMALVFWGFAHGAQMMYFNSKAGVAWMIGSVVVACLGVFASYKFKK